MNAEEIRLAKAELAEATKRYKRHDKGRREAGDLAIAKAIELLHAGVGPTEVASLSPFTDAYIRKYAREAGIPPARPPRGVTRKVDGGSQS